MQSSYTATICFHTVATNSHVTEQINRKFKVPNKCMIEDVSNGETNWLSKVKHLLEYNGFAEVWKYRDSVVSNLFIPFLRQRLMIYLFVLDDSFTS